MLMKPTKHFIIQHQHCRQTLSLDMFDPDCFVCCLLGTDLLFGIIGVLWEAAVVEFDEKKHLATQRLTQNT